MTNWKYTDSPLLRSFDNPISVRIEVDDDHGLLITTIATGRGEATGIESKEERRLEKKEINNSNFP